MPEDFTRYVKTSSPPPLNINTICMCVGTVAFLDQKQPYSGSGPSLLPLLQQVQASWHHSPHTDDLQTIRQIVLADITFCITFIRLSIRDISQVTMTTVLCTLNKEQSEII